MRFQLVTGSSFLTVPKNTHSSLYSSHLDYILSIRSPPVLACRICSWYDLSDTHSDSQLGWSNVTVDTFAGTDTSSLILLWFLKKYKSCFSSSSYMHQVKCDLIALNRSVWHQVVYYFSSFFHFVLLSPGLLILLCSKFFMIEGRGCVTYDVGMLFVLFNQKVALKRKRGRENSTFTTKDLRKRIERRMGIQ